MYKTKQMSYSRQERPIWSCRNEYLSKKERISELTVSSKSLRLVTEKYFRLKLLYCWYSSSIWTTVNAQLTQLKFIERIIIITGGAWWNRCTWFSSHW